MIKPVSDWELYLEERLRAIRGDLFPRIFHLPLNLLWPNVPAIPVSLEQTITTVGSLLIRTFQTKQAMQGLCNQYSIGGVTAYGRDFLYDQTSSTKLVASLKELQSSPILNPILVESFVKTVLEVAKSDVQKVSASESAGGLTGLSLEDSTQWSISWTVFPQVYQNAHGQGLDIEWAKTMTSADEATRQFWPMIAEFGLGFNLLMLEKVKLSLADDIRTTFASIWRHDLTKAYDDQRLYVIDLRQFENLTPQQVAGRTRFTPGSLVLLSQDGSTKALTPIAIRISSEGGACARIYCRDTVRPTQPGCTRCWPPRRRSPCTASGSVMFIIGTSSRPPCR